MSLTVNNYMSTGASDLSGASITTGNISITKRSSFSSGKAQNKKSVNYNPKKLSSQLARAVKARNASAVLTKAQTTVNSLQRCLVSGDYDETEVKIALAHAKRIVKCAQDKVANLKEEENLQKKHTREKAAKEQQKKSEVKRRVQQKENDLKQKIAAKENSQVQEEKSKQQELIRKRRAHRNSERSQINDADLKYLQDTTNYKSNNSSAATCGVSVDLSYTGLEMNELRQMEVEMNAQTDASSDVNMTDTAACDTSTAATAASSGGGGNTFTLL